MDMNRWPDGSVTNIPSSWVGGLIAVAVALSLLGTSRYGVGVSPDSAGYLCAARSLSAGHGYRALCNSPYTAWPPLFPTVLAAIGVAGIDPVEGARFVNAGAMGGIILISGIFFTRNLRSRGMALVGICSIVLSCPLLGVSTMAWTEPLFVLLIGVFVLQISAFLRSGGLGSLTLAALAAAMCSLQRYTGVAAIASGVVLIFWPRSVAGWRRHILQLAWFILLSSAPLGLWMARNYRLTGMFTGCVRESSIYSLGENLAGAADTVTKWIVPESVPLSARMAIGVAMIVFTVGILWASRRSGPNDSSRDQRDIVAAGLVALVYIPLIVYTHQVGILEEPLSDRYLAPLAMILPWLAFAAADSFALRLRVEGARGRAISSVAVACCALWLIYPAVRTYAAIAYQMRTGAGGYSTNEWRRSPLVAWLGSHPLRGAIRSNAPDALYALTGMDAHVSPHRTWDMPAFRQAIASGSGETLVWFNASPRSYLYDLSELVSMLPMHEIATFADGGAYWLAASQEDGILKDRILSSYMVDGARNGRFTSEAFGSCGSISSWVLREDGMTESTWELRMPDGKVVVWRPSCTYTRSGDTFEFHCEGQAARVPDGASSAYALHAQGTVTGEAAAGEYRIEFAAPQWPAVDQGQWRIDVARPVYRLYSRARKVHAYAASREELVELSQRPGASYVSEGIAFHVYPEGSQPPDTTPVFRFSSKSTRAELYTISEAERDQVRGDPAAWDYRGIAWYAYSAERRPPHARAVHRFWSPKYSTHLYTMDEQEREKLSKSPPQSWVYQGVVWYALPARSLSREATVTP